MTLVTRLRIAYLTAVASGAAFLYLVTAYDPGSAPQWVYSGIFISVFGAVAGILCFFGFRIRMRFITNEYTESAWKTSLRQGGIVALAMIVVLGLAAGKIASALNIFFLGVFVISLELAARRRKHMEVID